MMQPMHAPRQRARARRCVLEQSSGDARAATRLQDPQDLQDLRTCAISKTCAATAARPQDLRLCAATPRPRCTSRATRARCARCAGRLGSRMPLLTAGEKNTQHTIPISSLACLACLHRRQGTSITVGESELKPPYSVERCAREFDRHARLALLRSRRRAEVIDGPHRDPFRARGSTVSAERAGDRRTFPPHDLLLQSCSMFIISASQPTDVARTCFNNVYLNS